MSHIHTVDPAGPSDTPPSIRSVFMVVKHEQPLAASLALEIEAWLKQKNIAVDHTENGTSVRASLHVPADTDLVLVLGGDGTLLSVARRLLGSNIPALGVNLGQVGFLAQVQVSSWQQQLQQLLDGRYTVKNRLALHCTVRNGDNVVFTGEAVNDMVIHRGVLARLILMDLFVGTDRLGGLRADGLIVSTPSGSTGYAASANGPLVHPDIHAFSITPICPFMNTIPPMVLAGDSEFVAHILPTDSDAFLTLDGQEALPLSPGERVSIVAHDAGMPLVQLEGASYFSRLRAKGFITDQAGAFTE